MKKETAIEIIKKLKEYYPDATCSLDFKTPFQMVVAVMLSAQCTDERVNKTTPSLFEKYGTPEAISNMELEELERIIHPCGFYKNKKPVALAGVMGGLETEITDESESVFLECAVFRPASIRMTASC